jgi:hypothetical protein
MAQGRRASDFEHMNEVSGNCTDGDRLLPWPDCDIFCINSYSGAGAPACGWRGRFLETRHDATGANPLCPRCGCATLLRIPPARTDQADA